jgi:hypothetical protein
MKQEELKKLEEDFNSKITIEEMIFGSCYKIIITYDSNDADYISATKTLTKDEFENDLTLKLVLSSIISDITDSKLNGKRTVTLEEEIADYLNENDLMAYTGWGICERVYSISISFYQNGLEHSVRLPDFYSLFPNKEKAYETRDELVRIASDWNYSEEEDI